MSDLFKQRVKAVLLKLSLSRAALAAKELCAELTVCSSPVRTRFPSEEICTQNETLFLV